MFVFGVIAIKVVGMPVWGYYALALPLFRQYGNHFLYFNQVDKWVIKRPPESRTRLQVTAETDGTQ